MATTYTYNDQTPEPNLTYIRIEILASAMADKTIELIECEADGANFDLVITFTNVLSGGDETILDAIVAASLGFTCKTCDMLSSMTTTERNAMICQDAGMKIYNTTTGQVEQFDGTYWNLGTKVSDHYLESITNTFFGNNICGAGNLSGTYNSFYGADAGLANTSGSQNSFYGADSGKENTTGTCNAFFGTNAGHWNSTAIDNTAIGANAMHKTTLGSYNTAIGRNTLYENTIGTYNVAAGYKALYACTEGIGNIAIGIQSGDNITTGDYNILIGYDIEASSATVNNELNIGGTIYGDLANDKIAVGAVPLTNECDLGALNSGVVAMKETTTPTTDAGYGKFYTKADNLLYFQSGDGNEHAIAYVV